MIEDEEGVGWVEVFNRSGSSRSEGTGSRADSIELRVAGGRWRW